ncbi:AraC-type DNA-binding protein [Chitinophaga sp. CF118]|uniref:helix-turn-helix domain-containing protein n=1 Tax=Chitinophaga sp. CF118 TaxID=1884367 RepID=UPI0008E8EF30|nr:helix-turn-helix domain-containing protein [Chitinophaga sp. CF118]SFE43828.1 AraC-type DNA-binding protein [Chitinophaga sp. CF118]
MATKKDGGEMYKHDEFIADNKSFTGSSFKGFFVSSNIRQADFDITKASFRSDFMAIMLVISGEVKVKLNLEAYTLTKNSLLAASPFAIKQVISANDDCLISVVSFTSDFLSKMGLPDKRIDLIDYFTSKYSPHWQLEQEDASILSDIISQLEQRTKNLNSHPFGEELMRYAFYLFLYELAGMSKKYAKTNNPDFTRKEGLVMGFINMVQLQFKEQRNVQQYAAQLHVTAKYLTETVKEQTSKTAGEIIDDFVMLEAKLLLDDHDLSIYQVAEMLNFSDQSFFGKFFKRHSGLSPTEYRSIN